LYPAYYLLFYFQDFLVTFGLATKVRLRVKKLPWFVSDTTPADIDWILSKLTDGAQNPVSGDGKCDVMRSDDSDRRIDWLGRRWRDFIDNKIWTIHPDPFWTYPHDYR
jgi:damage-control phosphatase, subfamily III